MRDAWQDLLRRLSGSHESFSFGDVARWKRADFEALYNLGLLSDGNPASHILCPECSGHWAEVTWTEDGTRAFIVCTSEGRPFDVDPEYLCQWEPNKERLITLLAGGLGTPDPLLNLLAGQLWRLGRCLIAGRQRDIFFAAIAPEEISHIINEIRMGYGSVAGVLLLPTSAPDPSPDNMLRIINLANATSLARGRIAVDMNFIEEQFAHALPAHHEKERTKKPGHALRSHRLKILHDFKNENNLNGMGGLARHLGVSKTALYGMTRGDTTRYRDDTLDSVLKQIGCSRARWNRSLKRAVRP